MDPGFLDYVSNPNGLTFQPTIDYTLPLYPNNDFVNGLSNLGNGLLDNHNHNNSTFGEVNFIPFDPITSNVPLLENGLVDNHSFIEDYEFSDSVLSYINQILVEEDVQGVDTSLYLSEHDSGSNLNSFNPNPNPLDVCPIIENLGGYFPDLDYRGECDPGLAFGEIEYGGLEVKSCFPSYHVENFIDECVTSSGGTTQVPLLCDYRLPSDSELILAFNSDGVSKGPEELHEKSEKHGHESNGDNLKSGCQSRKLCLRDDSEIGEGRSSKQAVTCEDFDVRSDLFDNVLLYHARDENELIVSLRRTLQITSSKKTEQKGRLKGSGVKKGRGKKQSAIEEVVDLRTLLSNCAGAVAIDDRRTANELLKKIRQNSSILGDGTQRLAHYLADGLEARLAGTGSEIYKSLTSRATSATDVLKAYLLYLAACPFRKVSNFFSNKNIAKRTEKAAKIHIIDFGILYGFQWPSFIQRQSKREGGPPKIKITGIDFPQPGFRPAERVEETGLRLDNYAQEFRVPFEYRAIAKRWDLIQLEDFDIDEDEVLIVSCMYRMKNLPDETMSVESCRNNVLKLIRKLNPNCFVHGVVNGAYNAPFFATRFKEALFHFSAQFDMLETIVPREYSERVLIERDLLAREALNVIACEGWERVERPETYKQWQGRTERAGFIQLPLDLEIKNRSTTQVRTCYHKDFVIDENHRWLLLGWKGRIIFALTCWKPA